MKFLTVCEGGNVRSVTLAKLLKEAGHEAIAVGWKYVSPETMALLCEWANRIVFIDTPENYNELLSRLPADEYRIRVRYIDIEEDHWGLAHHPDLVRLLKDRLAELL